MLTEPVVAALNESLPDARVGFATRERCADLVSSHPGIHRLHVLGDSPGSMARLSREIRDCRYTTVVDLHANLRTMRLTRASRAPRVLRYVKRSRTDAVRVRFLRRPFRASRPLVRRYLDALIPLGIHACGLSPKLYVADKDSATAAELLVRAGQGARPFGVVVPGAVWATKRWPVDGFAEVASWLARDRGLGVVVLGSAEERGLCKAVAAAAGESGWNAAGDTTLGVTAAVISRARVFLGNDSGPTHMSKALGVPTAAVFGPTDPGQFGWEGHAVVYRDLQCSACSFYGGRRCRLGHWNCMRDITGGAVTEAVAALLDGADSASADGAAGAPRAAVAETGEKDE